MPTEQIKINVESNLFNSADKIKTAHSYNIALPRTATNDKIFANAFIPASVTEQVSTHCYLPASLFVDGVPLFEQGKAVLTSVSDKGYNLTLLWGLLGIFDEIKREGLKLYELPKSIHWVEATMAQLSEWVLLQQYDDQVPQYISGITSEIYNGLDADSKALADKMPWILPSVKATTILNKIAQVYGLSFSYSQSAYDRINLLWHPLVTLRSLLDDEIVSMWTYESPFMQSANSYYLLDAIPSALSNGMLDFNQNYSNNCALCNNAFTTAQDNTRYRPTKTIYYTRNKIHVKRLQVQGYCSKPFEVRFGYTEYNGDYDYVAATLDTSDNLYKVDITRENFTIEAGKPTVIVDATRETPSIPPIYTWDSMPQRCSINVAWQIDEIDDMQVGSWWLPVRNYPDMTIMNYISELLAHIGGCIVGSVNKPNNLYISTFDEIMQAQPQSCQLLGLNTITMSLSQQAQKNIYKHKANEDDGGEYTAEGVIYTADETLALERTAFDSKFKVPIRGIVRLWEIEKGAGTDDKDKAKWVAKGDYIASNFDGYIFNYNQDFEAAIADYYSNFERLVAAPKVIEAVVRLSVVDLINFNLGKPVYIEQLGRLYLVDSIQSNVENQYKIKLVQI